MGGPRCGFATHVSPPPSNLQDPTLAIPERYRHITLDAAQKDLIKASIPALQAHGFDITKQFYHNMLDAHPELKEIFNTANQEHFKQPKALAGALLAYAVNIDDLTPLSGAVELMAAKHASLYVRPEQYAIVGTHLISAIGQVLGDAVTPELAEAWTAAYWQLAEILIARENQLYQTSEGWTDWADFRIARKEKESEEVTSFYLEPVDSSLKPLPSFLPGQFISIQVHVPELGHLQARQYSLSQEPNTSQYRISIKREPGDTSAAGQARAPGLISNIMHDTKTVGDVIRVSHPFGDFFLNPDANEKTPLVLLSGGVGLTPFVSMLNTLVQRNAVRPITWIHGARSAQVRAFTEHVKSVAQTHENLKVTFFEDHPEEGEVEGKEFDKRGVVDIDQVDSGSLFLGDQSAQYYICGPEGFMNKTEKDLIAKGVSPGRIYVEKFGTGGVQRTF